MKEDRKIGDVTLNFSFSEFKVSADHPELAKRIILTPKDKAKILYMCLHFLQPLRDDTDNSISVLSAKRSIALNRAVGGEQYSDHLFRGFYSCAADIFPAAIGDPNSNWNVERIIEWFKAKGGFKQLIWYSQKNFFHLAPFTLTPKEKQILYF